MREFEYVITDQNGIHARPAGQLIAEVQKFKSAVTFVCGERRAEGKSLFALMKMKVKQNEKLVITTEGPDEDAALVAAKRFISANL